MSDRGKEFLHQVFAEYNVLIGTARLNTSPYHPETDGLVERFNATLIAMMAPFVCYAQNDWDNYVQPACFTYRTTVHATTKYSPFQLMTGWTARQPIDTVLAEKAKQEPTASWLRKLKEAREIATRNTERASEKQKARIDKTRSSHEFRENDLIRAKVLTGIRRDPQGTLEFERDRVIKLAWRYQGPYCIVQMDGNQVTLSFPTNEKKLRVANIDDIEPYWTHNRLEELLAGRADTRQADEILDHELFVERSSHTKTSQTAMEQKRENTAYYGKDTTTNVTSRGSP